MTDQPLINGDLCHTCDSRRLSADDGEVLCIATPTGEPDCTLIADLREMEQVARQVAALLHRIADPTLRREIAERAAEGFIEALCLQGRGIGFDDDGFCRLCGLPREAAA